MKWEIEEPERGEFDFDEADRLVQFAQQTNKRVRGHPLVWDYQLPDWLEDEDWSAPELKDVMRDHISALMRRYRGRIDEGDVVNEPLGAHARARVHRGRVPHCPPGRPQGQAVPQRAERRVAQGEGAGAAHPRGRF